MRLRLCETFATRMIYRKNIHFECVLLARPRFERALRKSNEKIKEWRRWSERARKANSTSNAKRKKSNQWINEPLCGRFVFAERVHDAIVLLNTVIRYFIFGFYWYINCSAPRAPESIECSVCLSCKLLSHKHKKTQLFYISRASVTLRCILQSICAQIGWNTNWLFIWRNGAHSKGIERSLSSTWIDILINGRKQCTTNGRRILFGLGWSSINRWKRRHARVSNSNECSIFFSFKRIAVSHSLLFYQLNGEIRNWCWHFPLASLVATYIQISFIGRTTSIFVGRYESTSALNTHEISSQSTQYCNRLMVKWCMR